MPSEATPTAGGFFFMDSADTRSRVTNGENLPNAFFRTDFAYFKKLGHLFGVILDVHVSFSFLFSLIIHISSFY
jgi:hypothetical protein